MRHVAAGAGRTALGLGEDPTYRGRALIDSERANGGEIDVAGVAG